MTLIMVAPNGARRTRQDHAQIPVTDDELVQTANACFEAGASALHAHIRNADQTHLLNAARYQQLIHKKNQIVPHMRIQVTSEAAGLYASDQQIALLETLEAPWVSLSSERSVEINRMIDSRLFSRTVRSHTRAIYRL
jgi:Uncharacterized conserved protein